MSQGHDLSTDREAKFGGPPPERSHAQRWVLATQGILTELNTTSHLRVGGEPRPSHSGLSAFRLRQHWGVRSPGEARERIQWLLDEGHRFAFARENDRSPDELLGWDLVRAACVAGWSYVAYHLDLDEAWASMVQVARSLQAAFRSWSAVGESYAAGRVAWSGSDDDDLGEVIARLVAPGGGWDLPWDVDLTAEIPAPSPDLLPEILVDPSGASGAFTTINEALRSSNGPKRVRVRAGTYDESVRIKAPVELLAEGEVIVKNGKGAPLSVDHHAFVRGFHLQAGHDDGGNTMQAVWVGDNFARIVDCTMETERCGVYAGKKRAEVIVERCKALRPAIHGMLIENGAHMTLLDCVVDHPAGSGVMTQGDGHLYVAGLRVSGAATPALTFNGANLVELHDVVVEGSASHAMQVLGSSVVRAFDLKLVDNRGVGALFASKAAAPSEIHGGTLTGNAGNDLGVLTGGVSVHGVELGGGAACAVCVQNDGRLQLEGCTVSPTVHPLVWLMGSSLTVLLECRLRGNDELAIFADEGTSVRLVGCDVETVKKTAVVLRGVEEGLILGGRLTSGDGCLHVDRGSRVLVRDAVLIGAGTHESCSPTLAALEDADVVAIGCKIEAAGPRAVIVEHGARVSLTRTDVRAPAGTALGIGQAELRMLFGEVTAREAASREGETTLAAEGVSLGGGETALGLDAGALSPFEPFLGHHGRAAIEIDLDAFRPAMTEPSEPLDPDSCATWTSIVLAELTLESAFEIGLAGRSLRVETASFSDLRAIAERIRITLDDPGALATFADKLRASAAAEGVADDEEDESDGDEEDESDGDEEDESDGDES